MLFIVLMVSSVFLMLRFFGFQLRRVRHAKHLFVRGKRIRQHKVEDKPRVAAKPVIQFTLRGILSWTAACALVLGTLTTLLPAFRDAVRIDSDTIKILCWFVFISPVAVWLACGIRLFPVRIVVFALGIWIGWKLPSDRPHVIPFYLWTCIVFLVIRIAGYRLLRVKPNPIYEESPRPCN